MFQTPAEVISTLKRFRDVYDPRTTSLLAPSKGRYDPSGDPFRLGFLSGIEGRDRLVKLLVTRLGPRERALLFLWYVADLPPSQVARRLRISRMHCYRLRKQAIESLCESTHGNGGEPRSRSAGRGGRPVGADGSGDADLHG